MPGTASDRGLGEQGYIMCLSRLRGRLVTRLFTLRPPKSLAETLNVLNCPGGVARQARYRPSEGLLDRDPRAKEWLPQPARVGIGPLAWLGTSADWDYLQCNDIAALISAVRK